ncbi:MAG: tetratricopeptide repeat protein [Candidatus Omnitrophica bacterium]|nr:tetratricopeptide repeat protein [Candidatus Omnitrophota bacterium]
MVDKNLKKKILILTLLFVIAFLPRLICLIQLNKSFISDMLVLDSADYDKWAMDIARGDWTGKSVFYGMPFYPYFLGVVYFLFGHFLFAARLTQILIGSVNCLLLYWLAKRIFGNAVGIVAFLACALFELLIFYDNMIISTSLITFSYLIILNLIFSFDKKPTVLKMCLIGISVGTSCLMAANILMFVLVFIFWISFWLFKTDKKKAIGYSSVFLIAVSLAILPVTLRNYLVSKDFVLITAHGGLNFYLGNNPLADGANVDLPFLSSGSKDMIIDSVAFAERSVGKDLKASEVSRFWFNKGTEFIKDNPAKFFGLIFRKLRLFLMGYEMSDIFLVSFYSSHMPFIKFFGYLPFKFNLIFPLGILGLIISAGELRKRRFLSVCYLFLASYIFSTIFFLVHTRYKLPIAPIMLIFSAYFVVYLFENTKKGKYNSVIVCIVGLAILYPVLNNKRLYNEYKPNLAASCVFLGDHLLSKGSVDAAIEEFKKATKLEPRRAEAYNMLGLGYLTKGDMENAEKELKKAIELKPSLVPAYNNLGEVYINSGKPQKALKYFEKSLWLDPSQASLNQLIRDLKADVKGAE